MKWPFISRERFEEQAAELARQRDQNRILLSALLERAVSREAALMLRKPEELALSRRDMIDRAKVHYEARNEAEMGRGTGTRYEPGPDGKPVKVQEGMDPRHWRGARTELEAASLREAVATTSNDSVTRIEAKVAAAQQAARGQ
jgi:hypothetical protein